MKKLVKNIFLGCLMGISLNGFSQEGYSYKRKIEIKQDSLKWNSIEIPNEIYDKVKSDLSDIRIFGFKENDTIEVPYLVSMEREPVTKIIHSKIINHTKIDKGYYFTIENLHHHIDISTIQLYFSNENFEWKINLEGSHNQNEWFTLLEDYRILSIKNQETDYRFEKLAFGVAKYKYYRVFVKTSEKPELINAVLNHEIFSFNSKEYKVEEFLEKKDKENKKSIIEFSTKTKLPIYSLRIKVNEEEFHRPILIEYLKDSIKTEKGWIKNYGLFYSGIISNYENSFFNQHHPEITLNNQILTKDFRITIENHDNSPLNIESIELQTLVHSIYFKTKEQADYYLFYGNERANTPQYDIEKFRDRIISEPKSNTTLSDEIIIPKKEEIQQKPLFENKLWLWGIMILIIGILGYFSLKMIPKKE